MKILLFIFATLSIVLAQNPAGMKLAIKPEVLQRMDDAYLLQVQDNLATAQIEDIKMDDDTTLTNIKVESLTIDPNSISYDFQQDVIKVTCTDFSIMVTMVAKKKVFIFGFEAGLEATANNSQFTFLLSSSYNVDRLAFDVHEVEISMPNAILTTDSKMAKGTVKDYMRTGKFEKTLGKAIAEQLETQVEGALNEMTSRSRTFYPVPNTNLTVDYSPTSNLIIGGGYLTAPLDGTVFVNETGYHRSPSTPSAVPNAGVDSTHEVQVYVTDYVFESALNSLWKTGQLYFDISERFNQVVQTPLTTDHLRPAFTQIVNQNGDRPVKMVCYDGDDVPPMVEFNNNSVTIDLSGNCEVYLEKDSAPKLIRNITLDVQINSLISMNQANNNLQLTVNEITVKDAKFVKPALADSELLQDRLDKLFGLFVPYSIEFPLPNLAQITLSGADVKSFDGYVELGAAGNFLTPEPSAPPTTPEAPQEEGQN